MPRISNDQELRKALDAMTPQRQRMLGCRFAEHVRHLSGDERLHRAIATGLLEDITDGELEDAFKVAKAHAVGSYTECGRDTNWLAQADHFVAASAAAALTPDALLSDRQNRAWKAAVQARMAVSCAMMEDETASERMEAQHQYALAEQLAD